MNPGQRLGCVDTTHSEDCCAQSTRVHGEGTSGALMNHRPNHSGPDSTCEKARSSSSAGPEWRGFRAQGPDLADEDGGVNPKVTTKEGKETTLQQQCSWIARPLKYSDFPGLPEFWRAQEPPGQPWKRQCGSEIYRAYRLIGLSAYLSD